MSTYAYHTTPRYLSGDEDAGGVLTPLEANGVSPDDVGTDTTVAPPEQMWFQKNWPWIVVGMVGVTVVIIMATNNRKRR